MQIHIENNIGQEHRPIEIRAGRIFFILWGQKRVGGKLVDVEEV